MSLGQAIIAIEEIISRKKGEIWSLEIALRLMKEEQQKQMLNRGESQMAGQ
jgi:hypothetical protein